MSDYVEDMERIENSGDTNKREDPQDRNCRKHHNRECNEASLEMVKNEILIYKGKLITKCPEAQYEIDCSTDEEIKSFIKKYGGK